MAFPHDPERPQRPARQPDIALEPGHAAAELHDHVVQAIFTVGLHLQSTAEIAADPLVRSRIEGALGDLDDLVRVIRDAVFHLGDCGPHPGIVRPRDHSPPRPPPSPGR